MCLSVGLYCSVFDDGIVFSVERSMCRTVCVLVPAGLYCSGWVKTGPVGVIVTTMNNAFETAETILADYREGTGCVNSFNQCSPMKHLMWVYVSTAMILCLLLQVCSKLLMIVTL